MQKYIYMFLWRPVMVFFLPRDYAIIIIPILYPFLLTGHIFIMFIVAFFLYILGVIWGQIDPEFVAVWVRHFRFLGFKLKNRYYF